ncbi:hypothetical protein ACJMK2_016815 [Sinanodonta woodiana]|uniref:Uncharacterized protein n=1 Tax=Sinanodonta woodiana TaxID=1069815 RepID=A0ABD3UVY6_SINWO
MTIYAEDHKVVMKIFLEKEPWLLCNKWNRDHVLGSLASSGYVCTAHNYTSSLQLNCSSQTQGPLTSVRVLDKGEEEEPVSNTQQTVLDSIHSSITPSEDNTTPTQEYNWLTQTSKEYTNRSGEHCKESCPGHIAAAVVVSFVVGAITGVAILVLIYILRIKQLCFQTKKKTNKKFAANIIISKKDDKSENVVRSEPVTVEIPTEVYQYEDLYSSVRQTESYDVLKYANVANGCHPVPVNNSGDDYDSIRNSDVPIFESDSVTNSHCNVNTHKSVSYESVKIDATGLPVLTTKLTNINDFSKDVSISGDVACDESVSHDYFILEAAPAARCMDCNRNKTGDEPNPAKDKLESQREAANSSEQNDPKSLCRQSHVYCILEAQENPSDDTVLETERNICTYMNVEALEKSVNTQNETKEKSHDSVTPNDPSIEQLDHVYFVLESQDRRP